MCLFILYFLSSSDQGRGFKTNTLLQNSSSEPEWTPSWNVAIRLPVITLHYRSVMHGPFLTGWNEQVPHTILAKRSLSCRKSKNTKVLFLFSGGNIPFLHISDKDFKSPARNSGFPSQRGSDAAPLLQSYTETWIESCKPCFLFLQIFGSCFRT